MVALNILEEQLKQAGCSFKRWGRAEIRELANVLLPGEVIKHCLNGQYHGGFAVLAASDLRVLLIDKKPMFLTLEDIRFDMIAEVDYNHRLLNSTLRIFTPNQSLQFTAINQGRLRNMFNFIQTRVMEIRQHYMMLEQGQPGSVPPATLQSQASQTFSGVASVQNGTDQSAPANSGQQTTTQQLGVSHIQVSMGGMRRVAPIITAYTHLPMMSRQRRFLGFGT